jgi:CRP-like cAMP-binding protein
MNDGEPELLRGLPPGEAERLSELGARITLTSGAELFNMGTEADRLYTVVQGRVKLTLPMRVRGVERDVLVDERGSGQIVGWSALIPPYRFTLTATAMVQSEVLAISRDALRSHFAEFPDVGYTVSLNLAAVVGERLQLFQAMWLREIARMVEMRCA